MTWPGPNRRTVGGEKIGGVWCHVWRRHEALRDTYFVEDLFVCADGAIGCERLTDPAGLGGCWIRGWSRPGIPG